MSSKKFIAGVIFLLGKVWKMYLTVWKVLLEEFWIKIRSCRENFYEKLFCKIICVKFTPLELSSSFINEFLNSENLNSTQQNFTQSPKVPPSLVTE